MIKKNNWSIFTQNLKSLNKYLENITHTFIPKLLWIINSLNLINLPFKEINQDIKLKLKYLSIVINIEIIIYIKYNIYKLNT